MKKAHKRGFRNFTFGFFKFFLRVFLFLLLVVGIVYGLVYLEIFSIKDQTLGEIIVILQSSQSSINIHSGESANVTFFMRALSKGKCIAECDISFIDSSNNLIINNEKVYLNNSLQEYVKSYELVAPKYGEGQAIYNFNVKCQNVYSEFCALNNTVIRKTKIITLNYQLSEEYQQLKPELKQNLENLLENYSKVELQYKNLKLGLNYINLQNTQIDLEFKYYQEKMDSLIEMWNRQRYGDLNKNIDVDFSNLSKNINDSFQPIREFNSIVTFANNTQKEIPIIFAVSRSFNLSIDESPILKKFSPIIESIISKNLNLSRSYKSQFEDYYNPIMINTSTFLDNILENIIIEKNISLNSSSTNLSILEKFYVIKDYCNSSEIQKFILNSSIDSTISNESETLDETSDYCNLILDSKIEPYPEINFSFIPENFGIEEIKFNLGDNPPICCIFGRCSVCCINDSCSFNPLILVHGHLFNEKNSPDYSTIEFELLQNELEKNGYINAGTITPESSISEVSRGEWGLSGNLISVSATYYKENEKNLSISDYAANLDNEIKMIQYRTGQKKVDIIAYSMGGLVARRYLQQYGEAPVNKIILVAVPNNGTSGTINTLCPIFGSSMECNEMQEGSNFLNDLNAYQPKETKLYNFIGSGCLMDKNQDGDGIVTLKNSIIKNDFNAVQTFKINGNCPSSRDVLHVSIINVEKHPEVFDKILGILKIT
ncbi:MAG: alpha/beta fold hydrolase [Nanoarchaeota archaeon]|nr:alpha/beta fold hydrolase [Nanoarchaeota archaeon]